MTEICRCSELRKYISFVHFVGFSLTSLESLFFDVIHSMRWDIILFVKPKTCTYQIKNTKITYIFMEISGFIISLFLFFQFLFIYLFIYLLVYLSTSHFLILHLSLLSSFSSLPLSLSLSLFSLVICQVLYLARCTVSADGVFKAAGNRNTTQRNTFSAEAYSALI